MQFLLDSSTMAKLGRGCPALPHARSVLFRRTTGAESQVADFKTSWTVVPAHLQTFKVALAAAGVGLVEKDLT